MSPFRHSRRAPDVGPEVGDPSSAAADPSVVDVDREELRALAARVVEEQGRGGTPFGTYVLAASDPASELARHVERSVLAEVFAVDRDEVAREYGGYEAATAFICVIDQRRALPVGSIRLVLPGLGRTKSLDELERSWGEPVDEVLHRTGLRPDMARLWDIATLMVAPGYRTGVVSQALHQAACTASLHCGVEWFVTILDVVVLRLLQVQLRRVFSPYAGVEPLYYEGSMSLPVWSDLVEYRARLRSTRPELYETIFAGRNLEPVVSTPDWQATARQLERITAQAAQPRLLARRDQTVSATAAA